MPSVGDAAYFRDNRGNYAELAARRRAAVARRWHEHYLFGVAPLPPGHPFQGLGVDSKFWAADRIPANLSDGAIMVFFNPEDLPGGYINHVNSLPDRRRGMVCARSSGSQIQ